MSQVKVPDMQVVMVPVGEIKPYHNNPRKNAAGVEAVRKSFREFGVRSPILLDADNFVVYGHTRYQAAVEESITAYPCVYAKDMTPEQIRAYRIADNHVATHSEWDVDKLKLELDAIKGFEFSHLPLLEMAPLEFMPLDALPSVTRDVSFTAKDGAKEIDRSEFSGFAHSCPRCGFKFNDYGKGSPDATK